jgi:hypothetical protein
LERNANVWSPGKITMKRLVCALGTLLGLGALGSAAHGAEPGGFHVGAGVADVQASLTNSGDWCVSYFSRQLLVEPDGEALMGIFDLQLQVRLIQKR